MDFFGEAEAAGLEAQAWSALGRHSRAAAAARLAVRLQPPHFVRNLALYQAQLALDLRHAGDPAESAALAAAARGLLPTVGSARIRTMLVPL
jgi:hypothetical protein